MGNILNRLRLDIILCEIRPCTNFKKIPFKSVELFLLYSTWIVPLYNQFS